MFNISIVKSQQLKYNHKKDAEKKLIELQKRAEEKTQPTATFDKKL